MKLKLIPVIEVTYFNQGVEMPKNGPSWEYPDEWDQFKHSCLQKAGFKDPFEPMEPGASLYEIDKISDDNLSKIVIDHTEELRDGLYPRDGACPLDGGYVLQIDGENLFYPQCCGDLGDIQFWRNLSLGQETYYEGHPAPMITFENDTIIFDLNVNEFNEEFCPRPQRRIFRCNRVALSRALPACELALERMAKRIQVINETCNLKLDRVADLLIWENENYE